MLDKFARCRGAEPARKSARNMNPLSGHRGPGGPPQIKRLRVVNKVDADLFQHGVGIPFDDLKGLFVQDLEVRDVAPDIARHVRADGDQL